MIRTHLISDPSQDTPNFLFNTGAVNDQGQEVINPNSPFLGPASNEWNFTSWGDDAPIDPQTFASTSILGVDPTLGAPTYAWSNANEQAVYSVFQSAAYGNVYGLYASNGSNGEASHTCTFLSSYTLNPTTMDHVVDFTMNAKVAEAVGSSVGGTAQAETGFTFNYQHDGVAFGLFIQFSLTSSTGGYDYAGFDGHNYIVDANYSTSDYLNFAADAGPLHYLTYNLNVGLLTAISDIAGMSTQSLASMSDLSNWSLTSVYLGAEENTSSGHVGIGVDVADLDLEAGDAGSFGDQQAAAVSNGVYNISTSGAGETVTPPVAGCVSIVSNGRDTVNAGISNDTILGKGSSLVVNGGPGSCVITATHDLDLNAAAGNITVSAAGSTTVYGGSGSLNISSTGDDDTHVYCGEGSATISAAGALTVVGGTGSLIAHGGYGGHNMLSAGSGNATLTGAGPGDTLFGGSGNDVLRGAAYDLIVAGTGQSIIYGVLGDTIFGGAGSQIHAAFNTVVVAGQGSEVMYGQAGAELWTGGSVGDQVYAGTGNETIAGLASTGNDTVHASSGCMLFYAGTGDDTIFGSSGCMTDVLKNCDEVQLGSGASTIFAGSDDRIYGGGGSGSMVAVLSGEGNVVSFGGGDNQIWAPATGNTYEFTKGYGGHDIISNFDFSTDRLQFSGFAGNAIDEELQTGSGLTIGLSDGTQISVLHVSNYVPSHSTVIQG